MTARGTFSHRSPARGVYRSSLRVPRSSFVAHRSGVTLLEILVVVGIIGILVAVIGLVGHSVREKGRRELTRSIMDTLMSAIEEFHGVVPRNPPFLYSYDGWPFPPNDPNRTAWNVPPPPPPPGQPYEPSDEAHNPDTCDPATGREFYLTAPPGGSAAFFVSLPSASPQTVPNKTIQSIEGLWIGLQFPITTAGGSPRVDTTAKANIAKILGKIPEDLRVSIHGGPNERYITLATPMIGPLRDDMFVNAIAVLDAWKTPLRYRYYTYRNNNRPFLWSAGPDKKFAPDPNRIGDPSIDPNGYGNDDIFSDRKD